MDSFAVLGAESYFMELCALLIAHLTIVMVVGLSFRHFEHLSTAWRFTGIVGCWWLMAIGVDAFQIQIGPYLGVDYVLPVVIGVRITLIMAKPITTLLYINLFLKHHGKARLRRLVATLVLGVLPLIAWVSVSSFVWEEVTLSPGGPASMLFWDGGTSWDVPIGWIIWYVGLFGMEPKSFSGPAIHATAAAETDEMSSR